MNIALWIAAGVLAAAFLVAGLTKLFIPYETLRKTPGAGWVNDFPRPFVKSLGALEVLGAIGLILPALSGVAPGLTPAAAIGLGMVMIGAAAVSFRRHEPRHAMVNLAYLLLAAFVAWGRLGPAPFG